MGPLRRSSGRFARQTAGIGFLVAGALLFVVGVLVLTQGASRLGATGWFLFAIVVVVWAMLLVPFLVTGVKLRSSGSGRHQAELERRRAEQRFHFGLSSKRPDSDDD